jgi:hypothetical protein
MRDATAQALGMSTDSVSDAVWAIGNSTAAATNQVAIDSASILKALRDSDANFAQVSDIGQNITGISARALASLLAVIQAQYLNVSAGLSTKQQEQLNQTASVRAVLTLAQELIAAAQNATIAGFASLGARTQLVASDVDEWTDTEARQVLEEYASPLVQAVTGNASAASAFANSKLPLENTIVSQMQKVAQAEQSTWRLLNESTAEIETLAEKINASISTASVSAKVPAWLASMQEAINKDIGDIQGAILSRGK